MLSADFSPEALQALKEWDNTFKFLKEETAKGILPNIVVFSEIKEKQRFPKQTKVEGVHHH